MSEIYGTGQVSFNSRSAAEVASMGNPVEMLRQLSAGGSISLSGADFAETVQHLQSMAIIQLADQMDA